jgi:uncharacterized protein (TIGR02246 family)
MPASTPEQIHRLFEEAFNAGDLDGLMELYEPDAALIAQPGSVAHGREQARAALQDFLVGGLPAGGPFWGENRVWSPADVVALWSPCEAVS